MNLFISCRVSDFTGGYKIQLLRLFITFYKYFVIIPSVKCNSKLL
jgi:hypothetical protein